MNKDKEKMCGYCKNKFFATEGHQKYCSAKCKKLAVSMLEKERRIRKKLGLIERVCPICGTPFRTNRINRIYCSIKCNEKAESIRKKSTFEWKKERKCEFCEKPFIPKIKAQRFCCEKCKYTVANKNKKVREKICIGCGIVFSTVSEEQKYCSISCASSHSVPTSTLVCRDCGKEFSHRGRSHARRCPECNREYWSIWAVQHFYRVGKDKKYFKSLFDKPASERFLYRKRCYAIWPRKCVICGEDYIGRRFQLDVHHVDGNPTNDSPENIIPLCRTCHRRLHTRSQNSKVSLETVLLDMWPSARQEIGAAVQRWAASHTANSVNAKPLKWHANTELSDKESVETVYGASHVDEEPVRTTTANVGQ